MQGLRSFKSTLTRLFATHHSYRQPRQIVKPRALGVVLSTSKSRRGRCSNSGDVLDQRTKDNHSVNQLMFVFPRRLNQLSRFHCCFDLALLFKKGVGREIVVLEVADSVFSNGQHSRNPVLKICGRRTAGDLPKAHSASRTFSWRPRLCSLKVNTTLLQLCGSRRRKKIRSSHKRFLRDLLASVASSQEKQRVQASRSNLPVLLNKVS